MNVLQKPYNFPFNKTKGLSTDIQYSDKISPLPDTQNLKDKRELPIDKVGVKNLKYPIAVKDKDNEIQHTIATVEMTVDLPKEFKGTHMSRFVEILQNQNHEIHVNSLDEILTRMRERLHAKTSHIVMEFPYFKEKKAPVTGKPSLIDYQVKFHAVKNSDFGDFILTVKVPVTTLCPCSKSISKHGAHNQRGEVTVSVRFRDTVWIEDVISAVEESASCELYSLLKREDEKYVTERAYENPVFVEDLVREVVVRLRANKNIIWYLVEAENFESIHNHNAYAHIESHNFSVNGQ
ncbi:MAG: GTP cyclohydrolase FolE2 [Chlorobi bacterium OLB4]|nr:MAG: GTP cyclohydrolase FolE2 [Chlorobi bacterium OLB4]MBV6398001.1 GTP cyclohydrolase FolE2 [Ignavibacteria bacterium]